MSFIFISTQIALLYSLMKSSLKLAHTTDGRLKASKYFF